jgi:menaquinone-dependent protoporphyrinogen oxidase
MTLFFRSYQENVMATAVLVSYATKYGSTKEAAEVIAESISSAGFQVEIQPAHSVNHIDQYELIILGAPLIMFR